MKYKASCFFEPGGSGTIPDEIEAKTIDRAFQKAKKWFINNPSPFGGKPTSILLTCNDANKFHFTMMDYNTGKITKAEVVRTPNGIGDIISDGKKF